ncbi:MAG TPA: hypothetical protein VHY22_07145 [Chthoniobacteraceae bacterium]|jgi:hypothetical protein|nr:hypothetical protein [Chthoniobacteraceae bacterium]
MKPPQFITTVILSLVALILVIILIFMGQANETQGQKNQDLQAQLQKQQELINKGSMSQQIGVNMLKDIASASVKDPKLKDLLSRNGYTVTVNPTSSPSPASTPASSPTP